MGRKGKWEYFRVIYGRYGKADRKAKREMLNEFCLTTGYHRKYAIRILNGPAPGKGPARPVRKRGLSYGHELLSVLTSVWEAAGYPWSVRLKALLCLLAYPFIPLVGYRSGLPPFFWSNTPSADFCGTIRVHRFTLSSSSAVA